MEYQERKGCWPASEMALLEANQEKAVNKLYENGFLSWKIGLHSLDTLMVHFTHAPVYTQTIGVLAIPGREVKLKTTFIAPTGSYFTELER